MNKLATLPAGIEDLLPTVIVLNNKMFSDG